MKHQTNIARGLLAALLLVQIALAATAAESPAVTNALAPANPPVRDAAGTVLECIRQFNTVFLSRTEKAHKMTGVFLPADDHHIVDTRFFKGFERI